MEDNLMSLLDELYDDIQEQEVKELGINIEEDNYRILNVNQANFFLRRLAEVQAKKQEINEMCDAEIEAFTTKVNAFRNQQLQTHENTEKYFNMLLEKFAQSELAGTNKKSLKLPFGTLQFRSSGEKYDYVEPDKILEHLKSKNLTEFIRTKQELDKATLKKELEVIDGKVFFKGEELEGIEVTPGETKFSVKI